MTTRSANHRACPRKIGQTLPVLIAFCSAPMVVAGEISTEVRLVPVLRGGIDQTNAQTHSTEPPVPEGEKGNIQDNKERALITARKQKPDSKIVNGNNITVAARGDLIDIPSLMNATTDGHWYHIPEWLSGVWKRWPAAAFAVAGLSGKELTDTIRRGVQRDSEGGVWAYTDDPRIIVYDGGKMVRCVTDFRVVQNSAKLFEVLGNVTEIITRPSSPIIMSVSHTPVDLIYRPVADGEIRINTSGPLGENWFAGISEKRLYPFKEVDADLRYDFKGSFARFMKSQSEAKRPD